LQVAGCRLQVAGCRLQVAGCRLQVAGCRLQVAGKKMDWSVSPNFRSRNLSLCSVTLKNKEL
jgi:hypothetical protein